MRYPARYPEQIINRIINFKGKYFIVHLQFESDNSDADTIEAALIGTLISNLANYPNHRIVAPYVMEGVCGYTLEDCALLFDSYGIEFDDVIVTVRPYEKA